MCMVHPSEPVIQLRVSDADNFTIWPGMKRRSRRHFILCLPTFRRNCRDWLIELDGKMPATVFQILMHSDFDAFNEMMGVKTLRLEVFAIVLYFFDSNDAPISLRRSFWNLLLEPPVFEGIVGDNHPYIKLFLAVSKLPVREMAVVGAFYNIRTKERIHDTGSKFSSFNIWNCPGVYNEGRGGGVRRVSTALYYPADSGDEAVEWDWHCLLSEEMVIKHSDVDCYPLNKACDEEAISFGVNSE